MDRFTSLEAFVVGVEDHTTLLRLYLERLRRAPHNPAYHLAVCEHTDELLTAVRELRRDQNNLSPHTREGVEALLSLAEAGAALALRLASFAPEQQTSALDGLTQATTCFVDMVRTMSDTGRVIEVSLTHQITQRLQGFLAAPLSATPDTNQQTRRITTEVTFDGNEDPFDDLAVDLDDDFLDDVIGSLEGAFDAATHPSSEFALPEGIWQSETDPGVPPEVRQLFADIATGYVQPIKDFITELRKGAFARDWLEACRPAVVNLRRASQSIAFTDLSIRLERLEAVLLQDHSEGDRRRYGRHWKLRVLSAYADLEDYLPATFFIPPAPTSSESIVLTTLLKQVEGVGQKTIQKLFAAGMSRLESYTTGLPSDIALAAGIKRTLAERICQRIDAYLRARETTDTAGPQRLLGLVEELKQRQFEFKRATLEEWYRRTDSTEKKRCRKARQETMWRINIALVELEQLDVLHEIRNAVFDKRIRRLEELVATLLRTP
ncbi:hypothetical protein [Chloracidobacterium thermophilum]|uniref:Uncharacterized protein n=1 Tax=Chloracidobacterium thermophilum (strain B) TaxID=981222 RepID=G2LG91_CHLTF|nr:hypothetical protein [Chloracidobacterium thermophilum]AEP12604.1 hypothetical protein Cabther_A1858 [Chloracidobacterium thermophilum B]QUV78350.1 hypothetical protein J8C08_09640 [Chloracidobacterium thermophilum]